jgi:ABC-2 type transport system ATP-binding protein
VSDNQALLAARGVTRRFGAQTALHATDLDVRGGETLALVGPNGAGKSTLLAILAGSLDPNEGGVDRREGVRIGWTPQRPGHYGRLSARENLELFARLEGVAEPSAAAARLLDEFGLPDDGKPSGELSVGNRQRLNLALSLLGDPDVLLLDEPTTALDPRQRRRLWESTTRFKADGGAVVFATQNLDEVARFADRVAVLLEGVVVFQGSLADYEREGLAEAFA